MANNLPQTTDKGEFSLLGFLAFAIVVALFLFASTKAGTRGMGVLMIVGAVMQQLKGRIAYGWEDQAPSGYITGALATGLNLLFAVLGVGTAIWPEVAMGIFGWGNV